MNCIIVDDDLLSRKVIQALVKKTTNLNLIASCESALDAIKVMQDESIDLIFLDIGMPEMSGMEFVQTLREPPQIIFITGSSDFAAEAFEHQVVDYILKPVDTKRFLKAVQKAQTIYERTNAGLISKRFICVKKDKVLLKIPISNVQYIEAQADYVMIYTDEAKHMVHSTLTNILKKLPLLEFERIHRSYIVNIDRIDTIEDNTVIIGDAFLPIGASFKSKLIYRMNVV